jgi:hypothetical protein
MLVIAKYFKYNDTRLTPKDNNKYNDEFYVNDTFINILKTAKVNVSRVERKDILYDLEQSNLITTISPKGKRVSFRINFVGENSDGAIIVKDMNSIIGFYPFYCEKCGRIIKNKSKKHNLCEECYQEHKRYLGRNRYKTYYYKNLTR